MKPRDPNAPAALTEEGVVPLESILCTEELDRRPKRPPDYARENRTLVTLAEALAESPGVMLQKMAGIFLEAFRAGSAGFSLLTAENGGEKIVWPAIAGAWKSHLGGGTPRAFGPCGDVLDRNAPLLFRRLERRYAYFLPLTPPAEECLTVPFYVGETAVGTIWLIAHEAGRNFDAEDRRQLVSMSKFASAACQVTESQRKTVELNEALVLGSLRQHELAEAAESLNAQLKTEGAVSQKVAHELAEKARLIDLSNDAIIVRDLDDKIRLWNKGAEKLFGWTFEEVFGKDLHALLLTEFPKPRDEIIALLHREGRFNGEVVQVVRDGRRVRSLCGWVLDRDTESIFTSYTDITARTTAEEALRQNELRLRYATEAARLTYVEVDLVRRTRRAADNYSQVMGYTQPDHASADISAAAEILLDHIVPSDRLRVAKAVKEFIGGHPVGKLEYRVLGDDRIQRWIETRWSLERDAAGQPVRSFATHLDITERKMSEEALHESEQSYRTLFESMDDGFCSIEMIFDQHQQPVDYRFLEVNSSFEKHSGMRNVQGRRVREFIPDLEKHWYQMYGKVALTGESARREDEVKELNRWLNIHAFRIGGTESRKVGVVFSDISERRQTDEALRRSEARFQAIVAQATAGIVELSLTGKFTLVNERFCEIVGRTAAELQGMRAQDITHPDDLGASPLRSTGLAKGRGDFSVEKRYLRPDGTAVWVSNSVAWITDRDDTPTGFVEIAQDISERKRLEAALTVSEAYFRELTQNLPIGVWTSLPHGLVDFSNRHWLEYIGQNLQQSVMDPEGWIEELHPDDRSRVVEASATSRQAGGGYALETRIREAASGNYRWFLKRSVPVFDASGVLQKRIGMCIDIDDFKRAQAILADHAGELELQVLTRTAELRETIGELEAFSYSVSHDMRAPLRALQGFAQLLLHNNAALLDANSVDQLRRIVTSAGRMDALINDVLTYSKLLRSEITLEPVSLDDLIRQVIATYPQLEAKNAEIAIEGSLPSVRANEASLTQVISNLLSNAVKFVARGTTARVRVWAEEIEGDVRLWIEDNGIGIAPEDQGRIWAIFTRVGRAKDYDGTGIGLAIVRKAVERMRGTAGLESAPGQGTRFWLRLRRA